MLEQARALQCEADVVIADGPAGLKELTRALLLVSNLALIPCGPSVLDVRAASEAIRVVKQAQSIRGGASEPLLVLNKVQARFRLSRELSDAAARLDIPTAQATVGLRQAYPDAVGQGSVVWRMRPKATAAAEELERLFTEIQTRLQYGGEH